ncbi:cleavage and polyadenylation specificity factor 30 [Nymphaea thermarum]|nr:cleavage and polyadenylation specificity factor 30 [Nymphaea thermarum]
MEQMIVVKFLAGLSSDYSASKAQMLTGSDFPNLDEAFNRLNRLAVTLPPSSNNSQPSALASFGGGRGGLYSSRGRGRGRGSGGRGRLQCTYWGRLGICYIKPAASVYVTSLNLSPAEIDLIMEHRSNATLSTSSASTIVTSSAYSAEKKSRKPHSSQRKSTTHAQINPSIFDFTVKIDVFTVKIDDLPSWTNNPHITNEEPSDVLKKKCKRRRQSCNRENLDLSVQKGIWATQRSNEAKLNEAFDTSENVILIFSINRTRNFQGCARMMSKTGGFGGGGWKYAHGTAHYGRNFSVKWLKLCELSFHKTRHLRNPYNENLPVKISRDCQELEPLIGEQLASLLYLEPDSELMAIAVAAETKREEEKTKGVTTVDGMENPDIVPFEENEEEEEEESDEEEESSGHSLGVMQARGRGRGGPVWPPTLLARGGRSVAGMNPMGYPPFMMGPDAFGYGTVPTDGFSMPDVFAVAPRPFGPFAAPRFSGDFSGLGQSSGMSFPMEAGGPTSGMVFHGRPPQAGAMFQPSGVSMMMGAARGSFMGGLGIPPRVGRPIRMPFRAPPPPLPHGSSSQGKRDQRRSVTDRSSGGDRFPPGQEQSRAPDTSSPVNGIEPEPRYGPPLKGQFQDSFAVSNNFRHDESESEDEAPRRSRHGEGKKKRRDSGGGDTSGEQWDMIATDQ